MERCVGCSIEDTTHPIVGIGKAEHIADAPPGAQLPNGPSARGFVAFAVCGLCYEHPTHRRRPLKMSFFRREDLPTALAMAGSNAVVGQHIPKASRG